MDLYQELFRGLSTSIRAQTRWLIGSTVLGLVAFGVVALLFLQFA